MTACAAASSELQKAATARLDIPAARSAMDPKRSPRPSRAPSGISEKMKATSRVMESICERSETMRNDAETKRRSSPTSGCCMSMMVEAQALDLAAQALGGLATLEDARLGTVVACRGESGGARVGGGLVAEAAKQRRHVVELLEELRAGNHQLNLPDRYSCVRLSLGFENSSLVGPASMSSPR